MCRHLLPQGVAEWHSHGEGEDNQCLFKQSRGVPRMIVSTRTQRWKPRVLVDSSTASSCVHFLHSQRLLRTDLIYLDQRIPLVQWMTLALHVPFEGYQYAIVAVVVLQLREGYSAVVVAVKKGQTSRGVWLCARKADRRLMSTDDLGTCSCQHEHVPRSSEDLQQQTLQY